MSAGQRGPYAGARFSILTQHGKEREMAPLFADGLDVRLELAMGFDTDSFGSFTREVARQGNQLEAARAKATKGMELLALDFGIASEGSFHPGSFGLYPSNLEPRTSNLELVVLVDRLHGLEIVGRAPRRVRRGLRRVAVVRGLRGKRLAGPHEPDANGHDTPGHRKPRSPNPKRMPSV